MRGAWSSNGTRALLTRLDQYWVRSGRFNHCLRLSNWLATPRGEEAEDICNLSIQYDSLLPEICYMVCASVLDAERAC